MGCTTETPIIEAYSGKTVIPPQKDTLFCVKMEIDQTPLITNQEWRERQKQEKNIAEIKNLLQSKKLESVKGT